MIAGICPHGIMLAGLNDSSEFVDEDMKREFATIYSRCERREVLTFEGECIPCRDQYRANCELMGIEP